MKRIVVLILACCAAGLVFAVPSPKPVEGSIDGAIAVVRAIQSVKIETVEITIMDYKTGELVIGWNVHDEDALIADMRTGYCMRVEVIRGGQWHEKCADRHPTHYHGWRYVARIEVGSHAKIHRVKAQVKVRYGTGGGLYTSWSPVYWDYVKFSSWFGAGPVA